MKTACEAKNSSRTRTLAHETRKNRQWLSMLAIAALAVSAVITSCNKDDEGVGGSITRITARVENANDFVNVTTVRLLGWNTVTRKFDALAEADFRNNGFALNLPETVAEEYLENVDDTEIYTTLTDFDFFKLPGIKISNNNAKLLTNVEINGYNSAGVRITFFHNYLENEGANSYTNSFTGYWYVDSDVNISASQKETYDEYEETRNISLVLKKGWNVVYYSQNIRFKERKMKNEITSTPVKGLKWEAW